MGLTTNQITHSLKNDKTFVGCFPSNKIPAVHIFPSSMIVNTDKDGQPGSHWVAVYLDENICLYFDSFGLPVLENDIVNFLKPYYQKVIYNSVQLQDMTSATCGHFCINFIHHVNSIKSYASFIQSFSHTNLIENDEKVLYNV